MSLSKHRSAAHPNIRLNFCAQRSLATRMFQLGKYVAAFEAPNRTTQGEDARQGTSGEVRSRIGPPGARHPKWRRLLFSLFSVVVLAIAVRVLFHEFRSLSWLAVERAAFQWRERFAVAILFCGLSFATVGLIEWRALRWAGVGVPIGEALKVSFIANGFAHSLGASAFVAGAVRARLYPRYGVGLTISAAVTAFQTATSTVGVAALVGIACLLGYGPPGATGPIIGAIALGGVALYLVACGVARGSVRLWKYRFTLPRVRDAAAQVVMGAADNGLAIGALWALLPPRAVAYPAFVADYVVAYVGGAMSGIPGGAGPFEGLLVKLLPTLDKAGLAAALLGFRLIFNLGPLVIAGVLFALELIRAQRGNGRGAHATRSG